MHSYTVAERGMYYASCELWPMTLTFELDLDSVRLTSMLNIDNDHLLRGYCQGTHTHIHTYTHTASIAIPGPLKWSLIRWTLNEGCANWVWKKHTTMRWNYILTALYSCCVPESVVGWDLLQLHACQKLLFERKQAGILQMVGNDYMVSLTSVL